MAGKRGVGVGWVANPYSQSGTKGSRFTIELSQFEMSNARAWRCPPAPWNYISW